MRQLKLMVLSALLMFVVAYPSFAVHGVDAEVTTGSADTVALQNKQNEPALAVNPIDPTMLAAGANDNIDLEACNVGSDNTCPFTPGVGLSGVQFSLDSGDSWTQPIYPTGFSKRGCLGAPGPGDTCAGSTNGPIGTLPKYFEDGLVSNGDPIVAFGPRPIGGVFTWTNGVRLYYANLATNFPGQQGTQGFVAIAVSRTDNVVAAAGGGPAGVAAWMPPVIASKQNNALFSDKENLWADNADSSPFFGNVYVCNAAFRGATSSSPNAIPEPIILARSTDGGDTWTQRQLSPATNNIRTGGRQGCAVRTDSDGVVYVFWEGFDVRAGTSVQFMARSFDGGARFERARAVATVEDCGRFDVAQGRLTFDGVAGARTNSFPSVDIANGAPTGTGAPDTIVMTWCDGPTPTAAGQPNEQALVIWSTDKGETWSAPVNAAPSVDRPDFPAIAISPNGMDVYLTYMNFLQPWKSTTVDPRLMQGVVRHASIGAGVLGAFSTIHVGATGDARGSTANSLVAEFLGDYNFAVATNSYGATVWNDVRFAASCPAINAWRQQRVNFLLGVGPPPPPAPAPQLACPATFGNSDIFGVSKTDPTP